MTEWEIPRRVWFVLFSWGLAVLVLAGLLSFWIWHVQREKDRAMCTILDLSMAGVTDEGNLTAEQRRVLKAMRDYQATLSCGAFR
jgi:hypothetical protein